MNSYAVVLIETAAQKLRLMIPAETAEAIAIFGVSVGIWLVILLALVMTWFVLQVIADWMIFEKAGEPGWKSIIPFYNVFVEYDLCWKGIYGLLFIAVTLAACLIPTGEGMPAWHGTLALVLSIVAYVMHLIQSIKLARSYGEGTAIGIMLFLFGPICRMFLGFGSSEYVGKP